LLLERNDLAGAERLIAKGIDAIGDTTFTLPGDMLLGFAALAYVRQARGDGLGALAVMDSFLDIARVRRFVPAVMAQAAAVVARLRLRQGDVPGAARWAEESGLESGGERSYAQEGEYLTLARVQIAQGRAAETLGWLAAMLETAEAAGRLGSVLEICVVQALALAAVGQSTAAIAALARALALGAPEGYIRVFADEGQPMAALLRRSVPRGRMSGYAARLLSAIHEGHVRGSGPAEGPDARGSGVLAEPLTAREREVLQLLAEGASNQEIARRFVVTVGTVKTHVHNILGKLAVRNRTQAISTARELKLL
jgi:LuxR family maltose regulon positive regulatory protein